MQIEAIEQASEPVDISEPLYEGAEVEPCEPLCQTEEPDCPTNKQAIKETPKSKKRFETSKLIVWVCLINGFLWVWCSYILAWFGRDQIAENLSQVAVTEIIGVVLAHCLKTVVENLTKNNTWPDNPGAAAPPDCVG